MKLYEIHGNNWKEIGSVMRRTGVYCSHMHDLLSKNGRYIYPFTVDEDAALLVALRRAHYLEPYCPVEEIPETGNGFFFTIAVYLRILLHIVMKVL